MIDVSDLAIEELERRVGKAKKQKPVADDLGISVSYLSDILLRRRPVSDNILEKMGYTEIRVPVKNEDVPDMVKAIENAIVVKKGVDRLRIRIKGGKS